MMRRPFSARVRAWLPFSWLRPWPSCGSWPARGLGAILPLAQF